MSEKQNPSPEAPPGFMFDPTFDDWTPAGNSMIRVGVNGHLLTIKGQVGVFKAVRRFGGDDAPRGMLLRDELPLFVRPYGGGEAVELDSDVQVRPLVRKSESASAETIIRADLEGNRPWVRATAVDRSGKPIRFDGPGAELFNAPGERPADPSAFPMERGHFQIVNIREGGEPADVQRGGVSTRLHAGQEATFVETETAEHILNHGPGAIDITARGETFEVKAGEAIRIVRLPSTATLLYGAKVDGRIVVVAVEEYPGEWRAVPTLNASPGPSLHRGRSATLALEPYGGEIVALGEAGPAREAGKR